MGDSFGHLVVEPRPDAEHDRIESHLRRSDLDSQWAARVNGNVVIVGYGVLGREGAYTHLSKISESFDRALHIDYHDPGLIGKGYLYAADGDDLTEIDRYEPDAEVSTVPITDYFKRELGIDGPRCGHFRSRSGQ